MNCPGPIIWFDVPGDARHDPAGVLECAACGMVVVTGTSFDQAHLSTPLLREGIATS